MDEEKLKENRFLTALCITLATIVIGLICFIFYSTRFKEQKPRCEYNGWAYADGQTFESTDKCNTCFCDDGNVICTQMACN